MSIATTSRSLRGAASSLALSPTTAARVSRVDRAPIVGRAPRVVVAALATVLVLVLPARATARQLADADVSGSWSVVLKPADAVTAGLAAPFKDRLTVFLTRSGSQITGLTVDKFGACGKLLLPLTGAQAGIDFALAQGGAVPDPGDCAQSGTMSLAFDALLGDNAHATALCAGSADVGAVHTELSFTAALRRISGMRSPTDPDGDGPGVPVAQIGSTEPGMLGAHDLAVTRIKAVKSVKMNSSLSAIQREVVVTIQNRGQHTEVIEDLGTLFTLVTLQVEKVGGEQGLVLIEPRPPLTLAFPQQLAPRKKLMVYFHVSFLPTDDPPGSAGLAPGLFAWSASVHHEALPGAIPDDHPADDAAPRSVAPPYTFDSYPDGRIKERGVGAQKPDGTFGDPVLTTFSVKG